MPEVCFVILPESGENCLTNQLSKPNVNQQNIFQTKRFIFSFFNESVEQFEHMLGIAIHLSGLQGQAAHFKVLEKLLTIPVSTCES